MIIESLGAFVWQERDRFDTEHNNMLGGAFGEIVRYRRFLEVIAGRHDEVASTLMALHAAHQATLKPGTHRMTAEQMRQSDERERLTMMWQLEIESAYLFAKILLDKVARGIEFYFGPVTRCALDSHDDLTRRIPAYAIAKGLQVSDEFLALASGLKQDISDFRDHQIAHEKSPRTVRGMFYSSTGSTRLVMTQLYPREKDQQRESRDLKDLIVDVDRYLGEFMSLVSANRDRSRLDPATHHTSNG